MIKIMCAAPFCSSIILENDSLRITCHPHHGGKLTSIWSKPHQAELLLAPLHNFRQEAFPADASFEESDCGGFDECLPSVSYSGEETPGGAVPDHGDFWRIPWKVLASTENSACLCAEGFSRPIYFEKQLHLQGSTLELSYTIRNLGQSPIPFLYASHPLFAIDPEDRILLPAEVKTVKLHSSRNNRLGVPGSLLSWPMAKIKVGEIAIDTIGHDSDGIAEMLYIEDLSRGWCALHRRQLGLGVVMEFDLEKLPYLGLWLCYGGWPEEGEVKQYTVAMEPTVAPHGSLAQAIAAGKSAILPVGKEIQWKICLSVVEASQLKEQQ